MPTALPDGKNLNSSIKYMYNKIGLENKINLDVQKKNIKLEINNKYSRE